MLWRASFTIEDAKGKTAQVVYFIDSVDMNNLEPLNNPRSWMQEHAPYLDALIAGKITRMTLSTVIQPVYPMKLLPEDSADIEEGAKITHSKQNFSTHTYRLPTFKESKLLPDGQVDLTDSDVTAYEAWIMIPTDISPEVDVGITNSRGDRIGAIIKGFEDFRP